MNDRTVGPVVVVGSSRAVSKPIPHQQDRHSGSVASRQGDPWAMSSSPLSCVFTVPWVWAWGDVAPVGEAGRVSSLLAEARVLALLVPRSAASACAGRTIRPMPMFP